MRKHFYLVTEHKEDERVGGVAVYDSRFSRSLKNESEPITVLDHDTEDFEDIGEKVYLGYNDFDTEDPPSDLYSKVMKSKIRSVDREWAEKAGLEAQIYGENDE